MRESPFSPPSAGSTLTSGFSRYVALGDSISIDLYPGLDVQEREGLPRPPSGLGAASLLYRNDDDRWPEFRGRLRRIAAAHEATPVDIHGHFLGHGLTEPDRGARWYWRHSIIEPSARGASEVRRLWVEALGL